MRELWVTERTPRGGHRSEVFAHAGRRQPLEGAPAGGAYRQHLTAQADLLLEQNRIAGSLLSVRNPTSRVYVFYFDHPPPGRDREFYGAWHSSDLWYTFNSLRNEPGQRQWTPHDFELAEQASSMWANFVKTGDPMETPCRSGRGAPELTTALICRSARSRRVPRAPRHTLARLPSAETPFHDYEMKFYGVTE